MKFGKLTSLFVAGVLAANTVLSLGFEATEVHAAEDFLEEEILLDEEYSVDDEASLQDGEEEASLQDNEDDDSLQVPSDIVYSGTWDGYDYTLYNNGLLELRGSGNLIGNKNGGNGNYLSLYAPWCLEYNYGKDYGISAENAFDERVKKIKLVSFGAEKMLCAFGSNVEEIDLTECDLSGCTSLVSMFNGCKSLTTIKWPTSGGYNNTRKLTNMANMFEYCSSLKNVSLEALNTSNVTDMNACFQFCESLESVSFGDTSNVIDFAYAFDGCKSLKNSNAITGLDTDSAECFMAMFRDCESLESFDFSPFKLDNLITCSSMFYCCYELKSVVGLKDVSAPKLKGMSYMFRYCEKLRKVDFSGFSAKLGTGTYTYKSYNFNGSYTTFRIYNGTVEMFFNCKALKSLDLSGFDFSDFIDNYDNNYISAMLQNASGLQTLKTPIPTKLGAIKIDLPHIMCDEQGNSYTELYNLPGTKSIMLTTPMETEEFTEGAKINYIGCALARVLLKDKDGSPLPQGTSVYYYRKPSFDMNTEFYGTVVGAGGYTYIISDEYKYDKDDPNDNNKVFLTGIYYSASNVDSSVQYEEDDLITAIRISNIHVKDLSFTQSWVGKIDIGATGKIGPTASVYFGPASVEASVASLKGSADLAASIEMKHSFEDGIRKLDLSQAYDLRLAAKVSAGPVLDAGEKGPLHAELKPLEGNVEIGLGAAAKSGLKIDGYDPYKNKDQLEDIGAFMLGCAAQSSGNVYLMALYTLLNGKPGNYYANKVYLDSKAGLDMLKVSVKNQVSETELTGSVLGGEFKGVFTYEASEDYSKAGSVLASKTGKYSLDTEGEFLKFTATTKNIEGKPFVENSVQKTIKDAKNNIMGKSLNCSMEYAVTTEKTSDQPKEVSLKYSGSDHKGYSIDLAYKDENAKKLYDNTPVKEFYNNPFNLYCFATDVLDYQDATATYSVKKNDEELCSIPFSIGAALGVGFDVTATASCAYNMSYEVLNGRYEYSKDEGDHVFVVQTDNSEELEDDIKNSGYTEMLWTDLINEAFGAIATHITNFTKAAVDKAANGVKNRFAEVLANADQNLKKWNIHVDTIFAGIFGNNTGAESFTSYKIFTYSEEDNLLLDSLPSLKSADDSDENIAITVGEPYNIYATDDGGNVITDWAGAKLTLVLSYNQDMLEAAGVSKKDAGMLAAYIYSEDKLGYICKGGKVDTSNNTVTLDISEPGQYILAIDMAAPVITVLSVSDDSQTPVITAAFEEMSGFEEFSMTLDGKEIVNKDNFDEYFIASTCSVDYKVPETAPLSAGKHIVTVYAVDALGNAMAEPAVLEFTVSGEDEPAAEGLWGRIEGEYTYTGKAILPQIRVYDGHNLLTQGKDYTVKLVNNVKAFTLSPEDAGFYDNKKKTSAPSAIITGKGNYSGQKTLYFKIQPVDISKANDDVKVDAFSVTLGKKALKPVPVLLVGNKALKNKTDYEVNYFTTEGNKLSEIKEPGSYIARLTGKGNFAGTRDVEFTVLADIQTTKLIQNLKFSKIKNAQYDEDKEIRPAVTVSDGSKVLTEGTEYFVTYENNHKVGTAYVVVSGNPEKGYSGSKRISFKITGKALKGATITGLPEAVTFSGSEISFDDELAKGSIKVTAKGDSKALSIYDEATGKGDFKADYINNIKAGKATIILTGVNGFTGTVKKTFTILPCSLNADDIKVYRTSKGEVPYAKSGARATIVVRHGSVFLKEGTDYTLVYKNNKRVGSEASVVIKGKGNYKDVCSKAVTYEVATGKLGRLKLDAADKTYLPKAGAFKTTVKIYDTDGKLLKAGTDYEKDLKYTYEDGSEIKAGDVIPAKTILKVTATGKNNYQGTLEGTYHVTTYPLSKAKISVKTKEYTGSAIVLNDDDITVKIGGKQIKAIDPETGEKNFEVISATYKNNVGKGKAQVTIRGLGNYGGTRTISFNIRARLFSDWWK